jgi:asparagine synthase (glutamine-hydrolysing)
MCGICGVVSKDPQERVDPAILLEMRDTLVHRGPDDCGAYIGPGVGLGHRRLSIIDLRPEGRQPMSNEDGSVLTIFNGEIYNYKDLRGELVTRGHRFRSKTDTEVIVHLYEEHGADCVRYLRGMFALAIWDEPRRKLLLARDRLGQKPLFYHFDGKRLLFGSEPKAILAYPGMIAEPDPEAINHYLGFGCVPSPFSAFKGIKKLAPAQSLVFENGRIWTQRYWRLNYTPKLKIDEREACDEIMRQLTEATRLRMVGDVPLGAFLSGGIDSSAIVAVMAGLSSSPVKTFSIGFKEPEYDERAYARVVAERFGTDHHEFQVEPGHVAETVEKLVWHYNEPYADSSALPTYYLSMMTRDYVTVALNGDAGDENFAGYRRYSVNLMASYLERLPAPLRGMLGGLLSTGYRMASADGRLADRIGVLSEVMRVDWRLGYAYMLALFRDDRKRRLYSPEFASVVAASRSEELVLDLFRDAGTDDPIDSTLYVDANLYLPDDLLVKVDIATMAVALEARSPMVDHEFMEFAARLPASFKTRGRSRKVLFKKALSSLLPKEVLDRPKKGFGVPLDQWFSGTLADLVGDTLLSARALNRGYFDPANVRTLVNEHRSGRRKWQHQLWALLMLEMWHQRFIDHQGSGRPDRYELDRGGEQSGSISEPA